MARRGTKRGNGEGSIRENTTRKRWEGRAVVGYGNDAKPIRRMVTGATKAEVRTKLQALMDNPQAIDRARTDLTVRSFLDEWADSVLPGTVAPSTLVQYRDVIRLYINPQIGAKRLSALTARDVAGMIRRLEQAGKAPNTQRLARSVLRRALRFAEHEGLITRNPAAIAFGVRVPAPEGRTLTPDQAMAFLTSLSGHRLEAAYTVMLCTGLRRGELLGLRWSDLELDATPPTLTVSMALKRIGGKELLLEEPKTPQSRRTIHLPALAVAALRRHRTIQATERLAAGPEWNARPLDADLVFRTPGGTPVDPDNFRNMTYRLTIAAGLGTTERMADGTEKVHGWSPHELRHSAASLLIAQGIPMKTISEVLGHSSIRVTSDVYGHLMAPSLTEAADAMDRALGRSSV